MDWVIANRRANNEKMDCPTVFRRGDKWYMTYLRYDGKSGKDAAVTETWLAESDKSAGVEDPGQGAPPFL